MYIFLSIHLHELRGFQLTAGDHKYGTLTSVGLTWVGFTNIAAHLARTAK